MLLALSSNAVPPRGSGSSRARIAEAAYTWCVAWVKRTSSVADTF